MKTLAPALRRCADAGTILATAAAWWWGGPLWGAPATLATIGLQAWAVAHPASPWFGPVRWQESGPGIALTFDDGPHPTATLQVLDLLAAHHATATFFCIGENARRHPDLIRRMVAEGHTIGLHSDHHDWRFNGWPARAVRNDLLACRETLTDLIGRQPRLFRPPMGLRNPIVMRVAAELGLEVVTWTATARDGRPQPTARSLARLTGHLRPGAIVVMHDGCEPWRDVPRQHCPELLAALLPLMHQRGLASQALQRSYLSE